MMNQPFNALRFVLDEFKNHKVTVELPPANEGEDSRYGEFYLMMARAQANLYQEFIEVYGDSMSKLAAQAFKDEKAWAEYGVFIDAAYNFVFAFNRMFADYDSQTERVVYKDPQDVLLEAINAAKVNDDFRRITRNPVDNPDWHYGRPWDYKLVYATPDPVGGCAD